MTVENQNQGVSPETFIHERKRGFKQGQRDLFTRAGVKDDQELLGLIEAGRRFKVAEPTADKKPAADKPPEQRPGESDKKFEERFAAFEKELGEAKGKLAAYEKEKAEALAAKEAADKAAAEREEADKAYEAEVDWFKEVAGAAGAKVEDPKSFKRLLVLWQDEIKDMSPRQFDKLFGDDVPQDKQAENAKKLLDGLAADAPGLFKAKEQPKTDPAGGGTDKKEPPKPGSTSTPAATPEKTTGAAGNRPPLDVRKIKDRKLYAEYNKDPKGFRERYNQGLIELK